MVRDIKEGYVGFVFGENGRRVEWGLVRLKRNWESFKNIFIYFFNVYYFNNCLCDNEKVIGESILQRKILRDVNVRCY